MPATVRQAVPADIGDVERVLREAFAPLRRQYTSLAFAATTPDAARLRARWSEGPVWVAVLDGALVGTVAAVPGAEEVYVRSMAVLPRSRGHGVGAALLAAVEVHARSLGARRLRLSTTPFLDAAIRLYERHGFVATGQGPHDLHGTPLVTLVKPLLDPTRPTRR